MENSSRTQKAAASGLARGLGRNRTLRALKARLTGLVDSVADWLNPGWQGGELQPIRIRANRGDGRGRR